MQCVTLAIQGDKRSGETAIRIFGEMVAHGDLPNDKACRAYVSRFCERIGSGFSTSKALGAQKGKAGRPLSLQIEREFIADQVDTEWLFHDGDPATQPQAAAAVAQRIGKSASRVEDIFKGCRHLFHAGTHDNKIVARADERIRHRGESVENAFFAVEHETNPRCHHSPFNDLRAMYEAGHFADGELFAYPDGAVDPFLQALEDRAGKK